MDYLTLRYNFEGQWLILRHTTTITQRDLQISINRARGKSQFKLE